MKPFDSALKSNVLRSGGATTRYAVIPALLAVGWLAAIAVFGSSDVLVWALSSAGRLALPAGAALALWIVPGMALISLLWRDHTLSVIERIGVAWGIGAALPPILLLLADLLDLPWNRLTTIMYVVLAVSVWLFAVWRNTKASERAPQRDPANGRIAQGYVVPLMIGLVALALIARLYTTREMLVGSNVDSYHHTLIVQLLVERQGLFQSWEPYAPLATLTYHYGFHANASFVSWLTGIPATRAVVEVGQIMNAATLLTVFALTVRLTGSVIAGVWAALIVGFYNTLPAFLTFWGRNPFVTSHVILGAVLIVWIAAIESPRHNWRLLALAGIVSAGLSLSHYQTTILAAPMILVSLLTLRLHASPGMMLATLGHAATIGAVALLLTLPWLLHVSSGYLDRNVVHAMRPEAAAGQILAAAVPALAPLYLKGPVIAAALIGLALAARRRSWHALLPAGWVLAALATAMPHLLGLPGIGVVQGDVAAMILYLMATPLAGVTLASIGEVLERVAPRLAIIPIATAIILVSAWGVGWQRDLVPAYMRMVTPADMQAMEWVRANTPPAARFIVNSHPIYGGDMIVGTDAGWWLPFFAGRQTNVPPMAYGSELSADPQYVADIHTLARDLRRRPLADGRAVQVDLTIPESIERLRNAGYTFVYSGAQSIAGPGGIPAPDRIDTARLRTSPHFRLVYDRDGVEIFELVTQ
ncbi:hypothetical protein [Roseiflexus sp.]|uniref:hypothetical protein n=1 Tax=Roseiflexus sp. TaxID=2562120 RepID=UPI0021DC596E|nr:hypothetical protein [Roseiflexus sp.]GIW02854.1 MAG: hypothetical protein KatS3mg058_4257 [Roseiflexus sp.]